MTTKSCATAAQAARAKKVGQPSVSGERCEKGTNAATTARIPTVYR
jgi:hypothetical protein